MLSLHIKGFAFRGFGLLSKDSDEKELESPIGIIQLSLSGIFNDPTLKYKQRDVDNCLARIY